jgi:villin 1/advillin
MAEDSLSYFERPKWTPISRMMESAETPSFKSKFSDWNYEEIEKKFKENITEKKLAKPVEMDVNIVGLHLFSTHKRSSMKEEKHSGESIVVYEVLKSELIEVPPEKYGYFSQKSCYIVVYSFKNKDKELKHWVFFWQGKQCPKLSIITWKMELSKEICEMLSQGTGVQPVTFIVQQGREPDYFLQLFPDHIVVFKDEIGSITQLFHIKSYDSKNAIALQVECSAASLNSGDAFLLITNSIVYSWMGMFCSKPEQTTALEVS